MSQKNLFIVIGITIFVLVVSGIVAGTNVLTGLKGSSQNANSQPTLQVQPPGNTPNAVPTSIDWVTYANKKYGYAIDYPSGWATIINVTGSKSKETLEEALSLDIFDSASEKGYPDGVMTITWLTSPSSLPTNWNESETTVNGIQVRKFEADEEGLHKETYVIPSDDGVIEIEVRYAPGDPIKQTFDTMLASFSLTR